MQRNYKSDSKESAFIPAGLSDEPLSAESSLFNIMETREIEGYPNHYVTDEGEIWRKTQRGQYVFKHEINWSGYHRVALTKDHVTHKFAVHRLVASYFIPNPENLPEVNHLDFNRGNNYATNLEWSSRLLNQHYSIDAGRRDHIIGEGHHKAKITEADVRQIRRLYVPRIFPAIKIANMFNIGRREVSHIINRKIWKNVK